jgi:hypothetical protein
MAKADKVYLPKLPVRKGYRHSYQGDNIVVVDPANRKESKGESKKVVGAE